MAHVDFFIYAAGKVENCSMRLLGRRWVSRERDIFELMFDFEVVLVLAISKCVYMYLECSKSNDKFIVKICKLEFMSKTCCTIRSRPSVNNIHVLRKVASQDERVKLTTFETFLLAKRKWSAEE